MTSLAGNVNKSSRDIKSDHRQAHEALLRIFEACYALHSAAVWTDAALGINAPVNPQFLPSVQGFRQALAAYRAFEKSDAAYAVNVLKEHSTGAVSDAGLAGAGSASEFAVQYMSWQEVCVNNADQLKDISEAAFAGQLAALLTTLPLPSLEVKGRLKQEYYDAIRLVRAQSAWPASALVPTCPSRAHHPM